MSNLHKTKIRVSPAIFLLMALFVLCSSEVLLCAILLAALFHELGHYLVLRRIGAKIGSLYISVFGAEIRIDNRRQLSYGDEMLAAAAGPVCNLVWALLFAWIGCKAEVLYLFSGAQLVLGVFNLLPVKPLDGGTLLWLAISWRTDPFLADRVVTTTSLFVSLFLLYGGAYLLKTQGGSPFLLLGALGLVFYAICDRGLIRRRSKKEAA